MSTASSRYKRRLKTSQNNVAEKQKRILSNTQFQVVQQNKKKIIGKKWSIDPQKKRHEKVYEKAKNVLKLMLPIKPKKFHHTLHWMQLQWRIVISVQFLLYLWDRPKELLLKVKFPSGMILICLKLVLFFTLKTRFFDILFFT